jgi:hypothetical protein
LYLIDLTSPRRGHANGSSTCVIIIILLFIGEGVEGSSCSDISAPSIKQLPFYSEFLFSPVDSKDFRYVGFASSRLIIIIRFLYDCQYQVSMRSRVTESTGVGQIRALHVAGVVSGGVMRWASFPLATFVSPSENFFYIPHLLVDFTHSPTQVLISLQKITYILFHLFAIIHTTPHIAPCRPPLPSEV